VRLNFGRKLKTVKSLVARRSRHNAFTLIELLVVIAIIAILAAILFPVFAQARAKARQAACLSNTKQIGLSILQYCQDYDNVVPLLGVDGNSYEPYVGAARLQPYVKSFGVFKCPDSAFDPGTTQAQQRDNGGGNYLSDPATQGLPASTKGNANYYNDIYPPTDYKFNPSFYNGNSGGVANSPRDLDSSDICSVADTALVIDWPPINSTFPGAAWWQARGQKAQGRHSEGSVIIYADGHAKWNQFARLYPGGADFGRSYEWNYWGFWWGAQNRGGRQPNDGTFGGPNTCAQ